MTISKTFSALRSYIDVPLKRRKILATAAALGGGAALMFTVATAQAHNHWGASGWNGWNGWGNGSGSSSSGSGSSSSGSGSSSSGSGSSSSGSGSSSSGSGSSSSGSGSSSSGSGSSSSGAGSTTSTGSGGTTSSGSGSTTTSTAVREPYNQPFDSASVWNIGIGSSAVWSNATDQDTAQLDSANSNVNSAQWSIPYYTGTSSDPVVTVTDSDTLYPVPPQQIHMPATATPALPVSGGDHHMTFYDQTQPTKLFAYYGCAFNNGSNVSGGLTCKLANIAPICGDGVNNSIAGPNRYDWYAGVISQSDIANGVISHALRYSVSTDIAKSPTSSWNTNIPWPDDNEDYYGPAQYTGYLAFGSTIGIPSNVNLNSLGLSQGGLMLAKALQQYGAIMRDTGGTDQVTFYVDPAASSNSLTSQMEADVSKLVPYLRVMRNQSATTINGGGTSIAPTPVPLDQKICTGAI